MISSIGETNYAFRCNDVYNGKIKLLWSEKKLPIPCNSILKYIEFNKICKGLKTIDTVANANGELTFGLSKGGIYQVYPIVYTEQLFIVSPPCLLNTFEGLSNPSYIFADGTVTIKGGLHSLAKSIVVKVNNNKFITSIEDEGERFVFKADAFRKTGSLELKLKSNTINYITIFVEFVKDGVLSYSPAIPLNPPIDYREAVTVLYSMEYAVSQQKAFKVILEFEADHEVDLPKLLLMQGSPRPMNKNAGKLCERIEGVQLRKGLFGKKYTAKVTVKADPTAMNTKFALFLNEESSRIQMKEVRKL